MTTDPSDDAPPKGAKRTLSPETIKLLEEEVTSAETRHRGQLYRPGETADPTTLKSANASSLRLAALIVDLMLIGGLLMLGSYLIDPGEPGKETLAFIVFLLLLCGRDACWPGGGPGKRICGLVLLDTRSGRPLARGASCLRQICFYGLWAVGVTIALVLRHGSPGSSSNHIYGAIALAPLLFQLRGRQSPSDKAAHAILVERDDDSRPEPGVEQ